jgi:hypothetical protein
MPPGADPSPAHRNGQDIVELQGIHRNPSTSSKAEDLVATFIPAKMFRPLLGAGIE